ncbi:MULTISPECIES: rubrerythrin [Lachnospiraceae]|jgi:rubrerythrin|uniref:Rubrerythrin family protein n=1 Tax=Faecalicatena acetigenes TaxID=2981790 RepID=A0ABT2TBS4_9FIRM|nr:MULTISPECIES: rubrerythrin family protein [Lachnospiraceae]MCU6747695.1 rubrerythrin family protein [Faecalicatena acetigenes]RGT75303.1 rubrerythrin family protein [Ruminococcus sp. AF18-22]SCI04007.1 NADH peroxidase [uncultured Clostridium sp.]
MACDFLQSRTKENLMRAFAGESQARNRYTIGAEKAEKAGMYAVSDIFRYTAEQERAHAERFYHLLKEVSGQTIQIDGTYPVDQQDILADLLRAAEHNEREEYEEVYQKFGDEAKEEGFLEAASAFYQIAQIEHIHQERFGKLAQMLENHTYYEREEVSTWMCTNCGYIHEGKQAPKVCPVCRHEQGYFLPEEFVPYKG